MAQLNSFEATEVFNYNIDNLAYQNINNQNSVHI